jgi:hypothetical protein
MSSAMSDVLGCKYERVMKAPGFATCQNQATNGLCIAQSAFQAEAKMDCARFIIVDYAIVAHGDRDQTIMQGAPSYILPYKFAP